jgi:uncharacterized protein YqgV (UPF0045/DUF77 family)
MNVSIEISLYPLDKMYSPIIREFIDQLRKYPDIRLIIQPASTLVVGEYEQVMRILTEELRPIMSQESTIVSIIKLINLDLYDQ